MKSTLALLILASILHSTVAVTTVKPTTAKPTTAKSTAKPTTEGPSLSKEAKHRKDDAGDLVKDKRPKSGEVDSGEVQAPPGQYCLCYYSDNNTQVTSGTEAPESYKCDLTDALFNMSLSISDAGERSLFIQFIEELQLTILIDVTLTDVEKVVECSYALKNFFKLHKDIEQEISFEFIGSWGYVIDFLYVAVDLQADIVESVVALDSNGNCTLFEALLNGTEGNAQEYDAVVVLIEELLVSVFDNVQLTYAQKMAEIYIQFKAFFSVNVGFEADFDQIKIQGFGSFESFMDVCHGYDKALTISEVIGGSANKTVLVEALISVCANTSYSLTVRSQLKQLLTKIQAYFTSQMDVQMRLTYISQQCFQLFAIEEFIVPFLDEIELDVGSEMWGIFYDILWCSEFCKNEGNCGNLDNGLPTTMAPTTPMVPANCATRPSLIVVSSSNTTILTTVIAQHYSTWNSSVQLGFNTCYNQIRKDIWNNTAYPTPSSKITDLVKNMKAYNANNAQMQMILFNITIVQWQGTIGQFVACG